MAGLGFTPARKQDLFSIETFNSPRSNTCSGQEAREFYENLVKDDKVTFKQHWNEQTKSGSRRRDRRRRAETDSSIMQRRGAAGGEGNRTRNATGGYVNSEMSLELLGLKLLRCAQEGDLAGLEDLLAKGVDINFQDSFFWTGIMCASSSGQRAAVRLLLERGAAWVGVVDTQGRDARDLASQAGHSGVLEELENYGRSPPREANSRSAQPQWCQVCAVEYTSDLSSHLSSTLHQFNVKRAPLVPYYCLPPSAKSYKMMLSCGWQPAEGLGPDGQGPMQPVATVLKRDQKGLGYGPMVKARVTHFKAGDRGSVKIALAKKEKGKTKEESWRKEQQDKEWERDFRASFYCDA
ncbi:G patch domain and ankyrin repeat-containing protein 1 [Corythoichthys intestinalis]|uniref:G patch domain and ankyrin repeat-containing protein 1 n=1 Tax=Corythoichthys intestinalis TaxID=161448 RepID=UPI0025A4EBAE|nr:G patch domain and ankyrin repeat-containing protein 1 [Corythoichthys intestinalis]